MHVSADAPHTGRLWNANRSECFERTSLLSKLYLESLSSNRYVEIILTNFPLQVLISALSLLTSCVAKIINELRMVTSRLFPRIVASKLIL